MPRAIAKVGWKIVGGAAGVATAVVTRKALTGIWRRTQHDDPPANPAAASTSWPQALTWAVSTGAALGVARVVAQRGAAAGWQRATGHLPPGLEEVS